MNKARTIGWGIVSLTGMAIVGMMLWRVFLPRPAHIDVDRREYPVKGIDISSHNGPRIDFDAVASDTVEFVYIKASEGENFRDSLFYRNYAGAVKAGLKVGAYHYFRFDREGWRQGRNMLDAIGRLRFDLPPAIDVEEWGNPRNFSTEEVVTQLRDMVEYLKEYGYSPVIYTNLAGYNRFIRFRLDDNPVWISSFKRRPLDAPWVLWQHSHKGEVKGIGTPTDINTFNGTEQEWSEWLDVHGVKY